MDRIRTKKAAWDARPRSQRKLACIRMKGKIQSHARHLGGRFTTSDVIDQSAWADIYFLSPACRLRLYNATVDSAIFAYFERCDALAWEASEALLPSDFENFAELFVPDGKSFSALAKPSQRRLDAERRAFGGLTRYEWLDQEKLRLADSGDVWVHPQVRLDFSYGYGVGLLATLPREALSVAAVDGFIEDFWARGEAAYEQASVKLSFPASRAQEANWAQPVGIAPEEWAPSIELLRQAKIDKQALEGQAAGASAPSPASQRSL